MVIVVQEQDVYGLTLKRTIVEVALIRKVTVKKNVATQMLAKMHILHYLKDVIADRAGKELAVKMVSTI